jgi:putative exosortase-associated protein (TIGR04073 family)
MLKKSQLTIALFVNVLIFTPVISHAAGADAGQNNANQVRQKTYGAQVGEKAMNGVTNLGTAWMEIPKNVVNTTQETNIIYGIIGGLGMGIFNTVGRMSTGLIDLVSAPIPSDPLVNPVRPWNDFDKRTTYGIQYHLEEPTNQMPTY